MNPLDATIVGAAIGAIAGAALTQSGIRGGLAGAAVGALAGELVKANARARAVAPAAAPVDPFAALKVPGFDLAAALGQDFKAEIAAGKLGQADVNDFRDRIRAGESPAAAMLAILTKDGVGL